MWKGKKGEKRPEPMSSFSARWRKPGRLREFEKNEVLLVWCCLFGWRWRLTMDCRRFVHVAHGWLAGLAGGC
ncbi:hypothetical protein LX32DRAFT_84580 [Colletotrichum zoysiae]|uniref:Uncharacterized protein n=1 Tax=Colletotrichum zoysiae TaxID=1216348 RepID=A0AAD9LXS1_9PEZI|nr:hypothetical protein LX32DRAFT_84580 [Colletotrichum zoysiae]